MMISRSLAAIVMATALCAPATLLAQPAAQATSTTEAALPLDQLVTKTVHEAWVASGRNEDKFFAMVQQLASLSAQNRGITLPDTQEAGQRFGNWIKMQARKDPDQLLYAVVDSAVRYVGKKQAAAAAAAPSK
jgi:type IV secretory pathway VirJ component